MWSRPSCWGRQLLWGRLSSLRPAFQPAWVPLTGRLYSSQSPLIRQRPCACVRRGPCHTVLSVEHAVLRATPDVRVEQSARLAMPASPWSKPPGLPCRRSRRQSHTIPSCAGVPTPSGPHASALHLKPPPLFPSPCSPCPLWFGFLRVLRVLRGLLFSVSSVFSVVCLLRALRLRALPTPSHNLPQIFFPLLFNHLPTPPFSSSCSPLVC